MSKPFKTSTAELIAIYRLEFYKKKRNWKLSHDLCKEGSKSCSDKKEPKENVLNKTYDIETVADDEKDCPPLNDAFLNSGTAEENLSDIPAEPDPPVLDTKPAPNVGHEWDNWVQKEEQNEGTAHQYDGNIRWPVESQVWTNKESAVDVNWHSDTSIPAYQPQSLLAFEQVEEQCPEQLVCSAESWLRGDVAWLPEELQTSSGAASDESAGSFAQFARGAHRVPHSSEPDLLQLDGAAADEEEPGGSLAELPGWRLAAAVRRHARRLRRLLREARARAPAAHHQWSRTAYSLDGRCCRDSSGEELPTRDTGPHAPGHAAPPIRERTFCVGADRVVAGSGGGGGGDGGRGRGRLRDQRPVIGIGMGRPYRL